MQALTRLLTKDTEWCWLHTHHQAFNEMKKALTMTPVLEYNDVMNSQSPTRHVRQQAPRPTNAQIEKEMVVVVIACEKILISYLYGR